MVAIGKSTGGEFYPRRQQLANNPGDTIHRRDAAEAENSTDWPDVDSTSHLTNERHVAKTAKIGTPSMNYLPVNAGRGAGLRPFLTPRPADATKCNRSAQHILPFHLINERQVAKTAKMETPGMNGLIAIEHDIPWRLSIGVLGDLAFTPFVPNESN